MIFGSARGHWTISADGLCVWVDHVWHADVWLCLRQRLLAGTDGGHGICRVVFRNSDRVFCLVDKAISLWADGVVVARPNVLAVPVYEARTTIAWTELRPGMAACGCGFKRTFTVLHLVSR